MLTRHQTLRIDFHVVNRLNVTVYTAGAKDIAVAWVKANTAVLGELSVDEVELTETRRRVYRPRVKAKVAPDNTQAREAAAQAQQEAA